MVHIKRNIKKKRKDRSDWDGENREHGGHTVLQPMEDIAWMDQSLSLKKKKRLFIWLHQALVLAGGI